MFLQFMPIKTVQKAVFSLAFRYLCFVCDIACLRGGCNFEKSSSDPSVSSCLGSGGNRTSERVSGSQQYLRCSYMLATLLTSFTRLLDVQCLQYRSSAVSSMYQVCRPGIFRYHLKTNSIFSDILIQIFQAVSPCVGY